MGGKLQSSEPRGTGALRIRSETVDASPDDVPSSTDRTDQHNEITSAFDPSALRLNKGGTARPTPSRCAQMIK